MAQDFTVGCRVRSPFGDGTVTSVVDDFKVVLALDASPQLRFEYSKTRLRFLAPGPGGAPTEPQTAAPITPAPPSPNAAQIPLTPEQRAAAAPGLKAIEALRFGLVPTSDLPRLTLGFDKAQEWILSRLPSPSGNRIVSQVNGPFGTGKSHMMSLIRHVATREGYAVAQVEVDGCRVSLADPASFLAKLYQSMKATGLQATNSLLNLYVKAIKNGLRQWDLSQKGLHRTEGNLGMVRLLHEVGELDYFEEELDSFLCANNQYTASQLGVHIRRNSRHNPNTPLYSVIGREVAGRTRDFIESLVSNTIVAVHAGYKGLVITIDEFEVEYSALSYHRDRIRMLADALYNYINSTSEWPKAPLALFFAAVGQEGHQGDEIIENIMSLFDGDCFWPLTSWAKTARRDLAEKIFTVYAQAYYITEAFAEEWFEQADRRCRGDEQNIRAFIKRYVAGLDEEFGPPRW